MGAPFSRRYVDTFMDIQGVVKEVHLVVPHSWVYLEVKNAKGEPKVWALEATGRTGLERVGVTADYVKVGRHRQGALPSSAGRLERLSSGISEGQGWNRQRLGRQQRAAAGGFLE